MQSGQVWQSIPERAWQNEAPPRRILIVDDDLNLTRLLRTILRMEGFDVVTAAAGEEALGVAATDAFDIILLDLQLPGMDGRTIFRELRSRGVQSPVLIASAYGARGAQRELGAQGAIEKPFDPDRLVDVVKELLPVDGQRSA